MEHDSLLHEWLRSQAHVSLKISADLEEAAETAKAKQTHGKLQEEY
jgi:hypothetical protein